MGTLLVLFCIFTLVVCDTREEKEGRRRNAQNKSSTDVSSLFRTFKGDLVIETKPELNGTQAPSSISASPALKSLSNGTIEYLNGPLSTRVIPIVYSIVVTVGIPANVAIMCTLATKVRKISTAVLYCSLAVNDLLLLLSLAFKAHYHFHGNHWMLGETACRVVTACFYGNLYCSAVTLACISVKRFIAVVYPFFYRSLPKMTCTARVILVVWGVFAAAVVPELLVQQSFRLPELNRTTCHDVLPLDQRSHHFLLSYTLVLTVLCLLVPLVVTVVCFIRIIRELTRSHFEWLMYVKASSLVFSIFMVCFLPAGVLHFLHYVQLFVNGTEMWYVYFNMAVCLCCLHACLDPFLFLFMSKTTGTKLYIMTKGKTLSISVT